MSIKDFPNAKKKLVIQNIPLEASEEHINDFFVNLLKAASGVNYAECPITQVSRFKELGIVTLEFRKRAEAEICLLLDDVKEFTLPGVTELNKTNQIKMRVHRPKRFIERWNAQIDAGKNPMEDLLRGRNNNFMDDTEAKKDKGENEDNELFMGGIPCNMPESQVKQLCESFG